MRERTLVLIKPEGVSRGLVGRIISRFEDASLTIDAMIMVNADENAIRKHYPETEQWFHSVGNKTVETYQKYHLNLLDDFGTSDPVEIGRELKRFLVTYLTSGPIVAMVLSGNHAVEAVRKLVGPTVPLYADPGTIRGDFLIDSPDLANKERRPVINLIHAAETPEDADREIHIWFGDMFGVQS